MKVSSLFLTGEQTDDTLEYKLTEAKAQVLVVLMSISLAPWHA